MIFFACDFDQVACPFQGFVGLVSHTIQRGAGMINNNYL